MFHTFLQPLITIVCFTEKMEPAKITQKPMNKDVKEGVKVKFDAVVKGKPKPEITWYKEEVKIEPTDRIKTDSKEVWAYAFQANLDIL